MSGNNTEDAIIRDYVGRWENEFGATRGEDCFKQCVGGMSAVRLKLIDEEQVKKLVQPLLYKWGRMGRVLGRTELSGWQANLAETIRKNSQRLERFRLAILEDADLPAEHANIISCYEEFKRVVYQIAAAKVLHQICPSFFPLWDNQICEGVTKELAAKGKAAKTNVAFCGEHYWAFMSGVQDFARRKRDLLQQLSVQYKRGRLKILDEFFVWAAGRPLSLFL